MLLLFWKYRPTAATNGPSQPIATKIPRVDVGVVSIQPRNSDAALPASHINESAKSKAAAADVSFDGVMCFSMFHK